MTMQVKEEKIDNEYQKTGQYASGLQIPDQQSAPPQLPTIFPAPSTYPIQTPSVQSSHNVPTATPEETVSENQVDFSSVKGIFGWTSIDGVDVPYIFRKDKMFVSVRIVEQKLLSKYPNSYPDDLGKHQPLTSFFITPNECKLLNEINQVHCGGEFGSKLFSAKDLIVLLSDFGDFYNLVKKTFPETAKKYAEEAKKPQRGSECGWLQVNNTVSPYVRRETDKYVPLSVMKYAAALNIPGTGVLPLTEECELLNKACKIAGFNFSFSKTTRIISLNEILKSCPIKIMDLPMENPLQHAQYIDLPNSENNNDQDISTQPIELTQKQEQSYAKSPGNEMIHPPYPQQMHPSFMDQRMMFSYNRHPFNMYAMQYGPPNVTVNPSHHHPYNQGMRQAPPFMNGQMPNQMQSQGSRNPTPEHRPTQSPARSPSNSTSSAVSQPKSPGRLTSPNHYPAMRPQMSPGSYPQQGVPMSGNRPPNSVQPEVGVPGHMMYPNPMANYMQNRANFMGQIMKPKLMNNGTNIRPGIPNNQHMMSKPAKYQRMPPNSNISPNMQHPRMQQQSSGEKQAARPPPSMSGPHQGPMNALQSMVTHQNGHIPKSSGHSALQVSQRVIPSEYNPRNQTPTSRPNAFNSSHNNIQSQVPNIAKVEKQPTGPIVNGFHNRPRQQETDANNQISETKALDKCVNQKLVDSIKGVWLGGKSISCMHLESPGRAGKFCLVEAVCKLYFSGCSVNEFLYALMNVLKVPLMTCTDDEEKAFIHYYSLPVTVLKCNKMIDFEDLEKFFPQLSYVFKEKTGNGVPDKSSSQTRDSEAVLETSVDPVSAMPMTMSEMQQQSNKRPSNTLLAGPPAKTSKRLEDTVQRLLNQQQGMSGPSEGEKQSSGAIIILDD